ncbi:MAG: hypothetical protein AUJ85_03795 [Elusimicrobia bacterium CG1_02_37_114]|nr:MAG: hypothetical protein AUJ85_03795 [Elusimicrobia bacterium CG1_02_37_114]
MEILNTLFTVQRIIQIGGAVFSFLFIVLTIQMYVQVRSVSKTVRTRRNGYIQMISFILVIISILLFLAAIFFL